MIQNLDLYPVFMQTAKSRSISRAAKEMHISQPAVSLAIGKLEDALGVKLFFRSNRGISLTNEGSILLEHLSSAFSLIKAGEEKLRDIAGLRSGTLRIGASDMTLRFFLLDYLERFRDLYPGVRVTVTNAPTPSTLEALRGGLIDFGVVSEPVDTSDEAIEFIPVRTIQDIFVRSEKYPVAEKKLDPVLLRKYPLILLEKETSTRRYIDSFFGEGTLSPSIELATSDLLIEFARRGIGITCVVEDFAKDDLASGRLCRVELRHELPPRRFRFRRRRPTLYVRYCPTLAEKAMIKKMRLNTAEILCVGTELLLGDIVNTDAAFISRRLAALGINQYSQSVVGDNPERLKSALSLAISRSDLVILTGGLGPTYDDLTKETAAELMSRKLFMHEESLERLRARIERAGHEMTENNKKQALIPEGSVVFRNDYGTAPGMAIEDLEKGKIVILLPGPPRECEPMFVEQAEPYLKKFSDHELVSKCLNIFGMGESKVESILHDMMTGWTNPTVAPYAKDGEVLLRVTAAGKNDAECAALCDKAIAEIMKTPVGEYVYGVGIGSLEAALVKVLTEKRLHVASAESCTGGLISQRVTAISGASAVLDGSIVTYANDIKERFCNVSRETLKAHGAVSYETAIEMARGVRKLMGADIGVSATGIAGPTGGTPEKPVGTVFVGVSSDWYEDVRELHVGGGHADRAYVRWVSASNALDMARITAMKHE